MKKIIQKPIDELEEVLPIFILLVEKNWSKSKDPEITFKIYFVDKETKDLSNYEKDMNFCFHLLISHLSNQQNIDTKDIDLFRVRVTDEIIEIYFKVNGEYSSIGFTKESFESNFDEHENKSDKDILEDSLNRIIDLLK